MKSYSSVFFIFILSFSFIQAQNFDLIPLGIYGGSDESNLSAYLLVKKIKMNLYLWMQVPYTPE